MITIWDNGVLAPALSWLGRAMCAPLSQLRIWWHHADSLRFAFTGISLPWKLVKPKIQHFWFLFISGSEVTSTSFGGHPSWQFFSFSNLSQLCTKSKLNLISVFFFSFWYIYLYSRCITDIIYSKFLTFLSWNTPILLLLYWSFCSKNLVIWLICLTLAGAPKENKVQVPEHVVEGHLEIVWSLPASPRHSLPAWCLVYKCQDYLIIFNSLGFNQYFMLFPMLLIFTGFSDMVTLYLSYN